MKTISLPRTGARPANTTRWGRRILIGIVLGYVSVLLLAPLAALVNGVFQQGLGAAAGVFLQPDVQLAFAQTLWICVIVAALHALFGTIIAWVIVRHNFIGKNVLNGLIDIPFALSPVVVGYMLLLLFGRSGLLFPLLSVFHIQVAFALPGMILATLIVTLPFMIRELVPVMETLDIQQEKAAATLGANGWQTFWKITFTALRWGLLYGLTLTIARALGEFGAVLVIGGAIQGRTETATIFIFRTLDERQYVAAFSAALLLGIISLALILFTDVLKRKWQA